MRGAPTLNLDLDSPRVILRSGGTTEAEGAPAMLTGRVMLKLTERASIKDIW